MTNVQIHPTAIVDAGAELAAGTIVGPYCVIGPDVVLGSNCWLQHHVTLCGPMKAGAKNRFYAYCSIGQQTQDLKYRGEPTYLEIGDENTFREFVTVNRSTTSEGKTRIGNSGNFLAYSHIGHDCTVGDHVVFSKIVQDIPPFMIADGNPAEIRGVNLVGLERKNYPPESVKLIKEAFRLIYRSKYNTAQALEAMQRELPQTEEITELIQFIERSERGIVR